MSGVRIVVGRWYAGPWGPFADVMVERPDGRRILLAPTDRVADFVASTYEFDEVRIEPVTVAERGDGWHVRAASLDMSLTFGGRTVLGWLLKLVPPRVATAPWWTAVTDLVARVVVRGVRTRGSAGNGRKEYYGATDNHAVTEVAGEFEGADLGELTRVEPAPRFGFSSTPSAPTITAVVTTVDHEGGG